VPLTEPDSHAAQVETVFGGFRALLKRFFEKHSRPRWRRKMDPEDLVQNVYEKLLKTPGAPATVQDPEDYIFRVAWNELFTANRLRRGEPRPNDEVDCTETPDAPQMQHNLCGELGDHNQDIDVVLFKQAVGELSPELRSVFVLRYQGHEIEEIAQITQSNPSTVKKRIDRAKVLLRQRLGFAPLKPRRHSSTRKSS
jgi:RNA polymerase sigma factor (sigma-70 family)